MFLGTGALREIGLDPKKDEALMWIAEEYFLAPLPDDWTEVPDRVSDRVRLKPLYGETRRGQDAQPHTLRCS